LGYFSLWEKALLQIGHMRIAFRLFRPAGESRATNAAYANANLGYFALRAKAALQMRHMRIAFRLFRSAGESQNCPKITKI